MNYLYWLVKIIYFVLPIFIVLDLIRDIYRYVARKDIDREELKWDFERISICLGVLFAVSFYDTSDYGLRNNLINSLINIPAKLNYRTDNEEINRLREDIKEKYNINVYVNVNPQENTWKPTPFKVDLKVSDEQAIAYLNMLNQELAVYNDLSLWQIPNEAYLVSGLAGETDNELYWGLNGDTYIVYDVHSNSATIHHEVFHSLNKLLFEKEKKKFNSIDESCELTSNYSCTSSEEFMSESWGKLLAKNLHTQHSDYLETLESRFLKSPEELGIRELEFALGIEDEAYVSLSDNEKLIYTAVDYAISGERYYVDATDKEIENALNAYKIINPLNYMIGNIQSEYYMGHIFFKANSDDIYFSDEYRKTVEKIAVDYLDIDDGVKRINELYDYISLRHYEDDYPNLADMPKEYKSFMMNDVLKALGYESYAVIFDNTSLKTAAVLFKYEDSYYWNDLNLYKDDGAITGVFMSSAQFKTFNQNCTIPEGIEANDTSLSQMSENCLFLEEYDERLIDDYIYRKFKNEGLSTVIRIVSDDAGAVYKAKSYLFDKDAYGSTVFYRLCRKALNIRTTLYCSYNYDTNIFTVYNFEID